MDRSEVTFRYVVAWPDDITHNIRCSACEWYGDYYHKSEAEAAWAAHVRRTHDE